LIIEFAFRLKFCLSFGVIFEQWYLFGDFLLMEDVIGALALRPFILSL